MKSGTQLIDNFFTEETKKVFIGIFKRKKEPQTYKKMMEDNVEEEDEEEENDEGEVLAKLNLVDKVRIKSYNEFIFIKTHNSIVRVVTQEDIQSHSYSTRSNISMNIISDTGTLNKRKERQIKLIHLHAI